MSAFPFASKIHVYGSAVFLRFKSLCIFGVFMQNAAKSLRCILSLSVNGIVESPSAQLSKAAKLFLASMFVPQLIRINAFGTSNLRICQNQELATHWHILLRLGFRCLDECVKSAYTALTCREPSIK